MTSHLRSVVRSHLRRAALLLAAMLSCGAALALPAQTGAASRRGAAAATHLLGGLNVVGLSVDSVPSEADRSIATAKAVHAKVVRVLIPWAVFEPRKGAGPNPKALTYVDRLTEDAAAADIKVIMAVERTPCWASSAPAALLRNCRPGTDTRANAYPPSSPAPYAAFMAYLAGRYGKDLAALEVWSEPDQTNEQYFAGPDKPARYAALLRAAYPAIKAADRSVTVLGGSLTGSNGLFLKALYADGIKGYYDGLSVHYYNLTLASVRSIHEVQLANGDDRPIWLDEFGWTSCWPRARVQQEQGCVTPAVQAQNIVNTYRELARTPYVAAAVVYKLQDSPQENFGVLSSSGTHKPAFAALAESIAAPFGPVTPVSLSLRSHDGHAIASGSGPVGDYMELEVLVGGVLRYRALFTLDRFNRFSLTLPALLGTHGLQVRVFQYWQGAGTAAQRSL